jgi:tetratricopeptide (TPR) repeat protein
MGRISRLGLALALLLAVGCERPRPRVLVLGFDGLDPVASDLLISEGKLPNFARLRREGAYGRIESFIPMLSPIVWTTIATGKTPDQHGIGHFVAVDPRDGHTLPVTSQLRRVKALWNIFSAAKRKVGVVGYWATWPPEPVDGFVVSDHLAYHFLFAQDFASQGSSGIVYPPELEARALSALVRPQDLKPEDLAPFVAVTPEEFARPFALADDLAHFKWIVATLRTYRALGLELWRSEHPDLMLDYFEGTDSTAHLFGHLFRAAGLEGELAEQQRKYGHAVESIYEYADRILGDFLAEMDSDTTLVVLSDHGFELGKLQDDPSKTRDMRRVSESFHRLQGILYLYGAGVRPAARIEGATMLDIAPTVLAIGGLPPARDMPGRVLTQAFARLAEPTRIATYETAGVPGAAPPVAPDTAADAAEIAHLKSLGYLAGGSPDPASRAPTASPDSERNLAAIAFEEKKYDLAARMFAALVAKEPKDAGLRTSHAGTLGALGRYDEALRELDAAIALDALNPEAYHNRGAVFERQGKRDDAIRDYRAALRYNPQYAPSREALLRLTGSAEPAVAERTPAERRAAALAEEAGELARRGAYPEAIARLEEARRLAPRLALVCQYESNVAYLMRDKARAIRALERCLALEPDNALFRTNLERLRAAP